MGLRSHAPEGCPDCEAYERSQMKEAEPERVITFPLNEFLAVVETYLTRNHPVYQFVLKHYQEQILKSYGLGSEDI